MCLTHPEKSFFHCQQTSIKILEQSVALAVAGFTDVAKVSDLIAKAVNAYQYNVAEASKISDILFVSSSICFITSFIIIF